MQHFRKTKLFRVLQLWKRYGTAFIIKRTRAELLHESTRNMKYEAWLSRQSGGERIRLHAAPPFMERDDVIFLTREHVRLFPGYEEALCLAMKENAGFVFSYTDEDRTDAAEKKHFRPFFKPDFSPELLYGFPYIGGALSVRKTYFEAAVPAALREAAKAGLSDADWYDLLLFLSEGTLDHEERVCHLPRVLFSNRGGRKDENELYRIETDLTEVLNRHLKKGGRDAKAEALPVPGFYRIHDALPKEPPLISILIPNKDHCDVLETCVSSLLTKNTYPNIEIIIIENNSEEKDTFSFYESLKKRDERIRIVTWEGPFNYAAINNFGAEAAKGELLLLLNNDTELIAPDTVTELFSQTMRPGVGAAGALLYYHDGTIQHGGVVIGIGGFAANMLTGCMDTDSACYPYPVVAREMSGCTAACLMVRRRVWDRIRGFDENLAVALNDVDLCMKIRSAKEKIIFTPHAKLYHYESKSRGLDTSPENIQRFEGEIAYFKKKWREVIDAGDPYYNANLAMYAADYSLEI